MKEKHCVNCQFEEILKTLLSLKGAHVNLENSDLITAKCTAVRFHLSFRCSKKSGLLMAEEQRPFSLQGWEAEYGVQTRMMYMGN